MRKLLTKQQVKDAIDGVAKPPRVPVQYTSWFNPLEFKGINFLRCVWSRIRYRDDIAICGWSDMRPRLYCMNPHNGSYLRCLTKGIGEAPPPLKKYQKEGTGMDDNHLLENFEDLDEFLKKMPNPHKQMLLFPGPSRRYKVCWNASALYEIHWVIRGMENALMDFYLYPDEVHKLYRWLTDYHKVMIDRAKKELKADAFFLCDDIGTQNGPFFSEEIFNEFFYPYYKELIDYAHSKGMQFWFHTCGDIEIFIPGLIKAGLDVLHPLQKSAMDQPRIFDEYHDQIAFMYGFDVQHVIPEGTADEVEQEVIDTMDMFSRANGRLVYTSGNVIQGDCPITSLERLMKVSHTYNPYDKQKANGTYDKKYVSGKEKIVEK